MPPPLVAVVTGALDPPDDSEPALEPLEWVTTGELSELSDPEPDGAEPLLDVVTGSLE
jgi:hypothetical protein